MLKFNTSAALEENTVELLVGSVGGELVSQGVFNCYYDGSKIINDKTITYVQIDYSRKVANTFYFDDISFTNYRK